MPRDIDRYDFFVSYARADNQPSEPGKPGWITAFVDALLEEHGKFAGEGSRPLRPFFDKEDIRSLDDWQQRLADGLAGSRLFLAFLSPRYFSSEWCRREWRTWIDLEIARHILSSGVAPIYIVEVPGLDSDTSAENVARDVAELCGLPASRERFIDGAAAFVRQLRQRQFNMVQPFYREGLSALRRTGLKSVLQRLARDVDERVEYCRLAAGSANTIPPYNRRFAGRLEELHRLRERLIDDRAGVIAGIHGLGGVGKSELAYAYAHAFAGVYPGGRFCVPCDGRTDLREAVLQLGEFEDFREQISDEQRLTPDSHFAAVCGCLRRRLDSHGRVLLVLDNVTDLTLLTPAQTDTLTATGPQIHLLATSRLLPPAAERSRWLTLGRLPECDALELLEKHRPFVDSSGKPDDEEWHAARNIVRRLGGFALAIELVAAWLRTHTNISYTRMAEGLGVEDLDILAEDQDATLCRHNHQKRLSAVLAPMLAELSAAGTRAMQYAAIMAPDAVPLAWLKTLTIADFPELAESSRLVDPWEDLWRYLVRLALLSRATDDESAEAGDPAAALHLTSSDRAVFRIHRLVQDLVLAGLDEAARNELAQAIDKHLNRRFDTIRGSKHQHEYRWEVDAYDAIVRHWSECRMPNTGEHLNSVGILWEDLAAWSRAEPILLLALATNENSHGPDHREVAISLNNLGSLYHETNRLAAAEDHYRRALAIRENDVDSKSEEATAIDNLASLFQRQDRFDEAETLYLRALAIREQHLGPDHPDVATSLANYAVLLCNQHRLAEAEPLLRRAGKIREEHLGRDHPDVGISLNSLALVLKASGRYSEAEGLYLQALAISEASHDPWHPDISTCLNNLAILLRQTNRRTEAEPLFRRALANQERTFGPDHPHVALALVNLSQLLEEMGVRDEIETMYRRALRIYEQSYGPDNFYTGVALRNLASVLGRAGRFGEAEAMQRQALTIMEHARGPSHPQVAQTLDTLAEVLLAARRPADAEPLLLRALEIHESFNGMDNHAVGGVLENLARVYQMTGRCADAIRTCRRAVEVYESAFGRVHPKVAMNLNNLATNLVDDNRSDEAVPVLREAAAIAQDSLSGQDLKIASYFNNLALALRNTGSLVEAEGLYRKVLQIREDALGTDDPGVADAVSRLARVYLDAGRLEEAEPAFRRALRIYDQTADPNLEDLAMVLNDFSVLLHRMSRHDEGEMHCRRALDISYRVYGPEHTESRNTLDILKRILQSKKDRDPNDHPPTTSRDSK